MKSHLLSSAAIALVFLLLSACDSAPPRAAAPTPNFLPTIDAFVAQKLAEERKILKVAGVPTPTRPPVPTNTPTAAWLLAFPPEEGAKIERCAGEDPFLKVAPSLVEINALTYEGDFVSGSGFIVDEERGFILTATHVVSNVDPESLTVAYRDGVIDSAIWVAREPSTDISLLYAPPLGFPALRVPSDIREALAESRGGDIADRISDLVAVGVIDGSYPIGEGETLSVTVDNAGWPNLTVDATVEPGMSGGPLVDQCGKLVGILSLGDDGLGSLTAIGLNQSRLAALMRDATSFLQESPTPVPTTDLRGRQELVDWVQLTWCLIREDGNLIDEWNALPSTPLTDAQLGEFRGRHESMRDRLWQASTPKPAREIRDKLIRSWEKTIAVTNLLLYLDGSAAESEELQNESNLLRKQAVELFSDLVETYELLEYLSTCS